MSDDLKVAAVSRRTVLMGAAGALPLIALGATGAKAGKMAQTAVRYQATPKDGKQCSGCSLFVAPNACKSVDGSIAASGWCALWVKKAG
ncbi:high potential iron-sulfur protein [Roseiarcus fermentans]|uniref:High-potential iron-sulfur protein n=1 Tax=Roseiarcus fermentans TaxID=1473586 RepID=A0A366FJV6_9HYPH|nr:high-potential iron-sulfur protein [Roseiarcus fermentans]RBP14396.1 high potential iron-sulfur protein [Roseiarcus fermentans]